jgi:hypothetical protein
VSTFQEGDDALLQVHVARANSQQVLISFESMEGTFTIRVPVSQLQFTEKKEEHRWPCPRFYTSEYRLHCTCEERS